ncbi:MAG: PD-(D/E)XK nuclease family protein [Anaerolineae bacterium]
MPTISPTRIRIFQECPQRFALTYIQHVPPSAPSAGPHFAFGLSLHEALKRYHKLPANRTLPADQLLQQCWVRGSYADAEQEAEYFDQAVAILRQYHDTLPPSAIHSQLEVNLSQIVYLAWQPVKLVGRVDRLDHFADGAKDLLDYKTTATGRSPTPEQLASDLPTYVYYTLGKMTFEGAPRVTVSQLNLRTLDRSAAAYTPEQLAANDNGLAVLAHAMANGPYEARPGGRCSWCPVRRDCPAGTG